MSQFPLLHLATRVKGKGNMAIKPKTLLCLLYLIVLLGLGGPGAWGQNVASIVGRLRDQSGAVLPGATVQIINEETGIIRAVITDEEGRYRARDLGLGTYRVEASMQGFQKVVRSGIILTIGREAVVDINLLLGELREEVRVTGDAPLVNTTNAEMTALVTRNQMADLPLSARSFSQLISLQSGTTWNHNQQGDGTTGFGPRISVSGSRVTSNSFSLDGSDISTTTGILPSGVGGNALGLEAMQEFKVLTGNYSAQYGRTAGANIVAVTRSGTNSFHGSGYEYFRNDSLDARNFFDLAKPEFSRNQFGASLGGPIIKDRTFFFVNVEVLRERLPLTLYATVPTEAARQGILPSGTVTVSPLVKPYLALWPMPNGRVFTDGTAQYVSTTERPTDQQYVAMRIDQQLSKSHSVFGRYTLDWSKQNQVASIRLYDTEYAIRNQYLTVEERAVISSHLVNLFRIAYSRPVQTADIVAVNAPDPSLSFIKGRPFGGISVGGGITGLTGYSQAIPDKKYLNVGQLYDDVSWDLGRHSLRMGTSINFYQFDYMADARAGGAWTFSSLSDFLQNKAPSRLRVRGFTADPYRTWNQWLMGIYFQDDFQLHPRLTLNLGLRFENLTTPVERYGRISNLHTYLDATQTVGEPFYKNPGGTFQPRIGLAWDPSGSVKTSVRASFGVFTDPLLMRYYLNAISRQPPFWMDVSPATKDLGGLFPDLTPSLQRLSQGPSAIHAFDYNPKIPYSLNWSMSIQRQLSATLVADIAYSGSRGVHLESQQALAVPVPQFINGVTYFPASAPLVNPNFTRLEWYGTGASSSYHALKTSVSKRYSNGFHFQTAYTFSKAMDTQSSSHQNELTDFAVMDAFDMSRDWGPAGFHMKHVFTANFSYELPVGASGRWGKNLHGVASGFLGGWQMSGILTLNSGSPFSANSTSTVTHPLVQEGSRADLIAGGNNNPVLGAPEKYFDVTQFAPQRTGYYGNVGRDTLVGPKLFTLDFSLLKKIAVGEGKHFQFRAECMNVLNHANFGTPNSTLFDGSGRRVGNAGVITRTVTSSRQMQLALRFEF